MRRTRTIAALSLVTLALLSGCGDDEPSSSPSTTTAPAGASTTASAGASTTVAGTSTTKSAEALKAAMLSQADVPGSTVSTSPPSDADFSACFPGNPLGGKDFPGEVEGPDLELVQGDVQRQYSSGARQATADQARDFVTTFSSEAGAQCLLNAFKTFVSTPPNPLDGSNLTAKATEPAVADDAALVTISGNLVAGTQSVPISAELLAFRKGSTVVLLSAGAVQGSAIPGQSVELAQKVAGRL